MDPSDSPIDEMDISPDGPMDSRQDSVSHQEIRVEASLHNHDADAREAHANSSKRKAAAVDEVVSYRPSVGDYEPDEPPRVLMAKNGLDTTLEPITSTEAAFSDMITNAYRPDTVTACTLEDLVRSGGFTFKIGTMCSGTEAPIKALQLIQEVHYSKVQAELFRFKHVFSVEIEPFKQGYIKRNTDAVVFRDVREFTGPRGSTATTALGSLVEIPTDIDVLVAGTSCHAFSALNANQVAQFLQQRPGKATRLHKRNRNNALAQQMVDAWKGDDASGMDPEDVISKLQELEATLSDMGESDATFFSMLIYIFNHRPRIVILENVQNAPYETARDVWLKAVNYSSYFMDADTKNYYLPQTRRRKYLVAVSNDSFTDAAVVVRLWSRILKSLERRASSSIEEFLHENTDKEVRLGLQELEYSSQNRTIREVNWSRSEDRHEETRLRENIGRGNEICGLDDKKPYDRVNRMILGSLPPRPKEVLDINQERGLTKYWPYSATHKCKVQDISQNVDRNSGSSPFGLTGCLTPAGGAWLTSQCRFVTGNEMLRLQGLPPGMTDMSRETHDQLKDLAGNAMTVTVVGAALLSAFVACFQSPDFRRSSSFQPISDSETQGYIHPYSSVASNIQVLNLDLEPVGDFGTWKYQQASLDTVLFEGRKLRTYCYCNGTTHYSSRKLLKCTVCGTIRCTNCAGNPRHHFARFSEMPRPVGQEVAEHRILQYFPSTVYGLFPFSLAMELTQGLGLEASSQALSSAKFYFENVHFTETITLSYGSQTGFRIKVAIFEDRVDWYLHLDRHSALGEAVAKNPILGDFFLRRRPFAKAILTGGTPIPSCQD
ncbi:S-adenosyl-L-methionine-dependent methyltransferase [Xylariales sp. PMI_506]|nr:S-adenosyl-L-methionine-dependent methyltransferase [Xylariales sp. PMI_506]